jgi:IS5 family transposase
VYRNFSRVGGAKMPDAKTIGRWGVALGPQVIKQVRVLTRTMKRIAKIAGKAGAKLRDRSRSVTFVSTPLRHPPKYNRKKSR